MTVRRGRAEFGTKLTVKASEASRSATTNPTIPSRAVMAGAYSRA
jgi:hypothetical protein